MAEVRLGGLYVDIVSRNRQFVTGTTQNIAMLRRQRREVNRLRRDVRGLGRTVRSFVSTLALFAGTAGIGAAVISIANLEDRLASVRAISGATVAEFDQLRAQSLLLGRTTRFTATEAAEGQVFLARAGQEVSEVLRTLPASLRLAQVGTVGVGEAADIATNALAAFREQADQADRFVDVLAKTTTSANTDLRQLADGLKLVAPVAVSLGVDLEATSAALGRLGDAGLQATLGGTGLRRIFFDLSARTPETDQILRSLGLTVEDVSFEVQGLTGVLQNLRDAGISTEQAIRVFGARGFPAFANLVANIPELRELEGELRNAGGAAADMAEIMDDTLVGAALRAVSAADGLAHEFGRVSGLTAGLRDALDGLAAVLNSATDNLEANLGALTHGIGLFVGALAVARFGPALLTIGRMTRAVGVLRGAIAATTRIAGFLLRRLIVPVAIVEGLIQIGAFFVRLRDEVRATAQSFSTVLVVAAVDGAAAIVEAFLNIPGAVVAGAVAALSELSATLARTVPALLRAALRGEDVGAAILESLDLPGIQSRVTSDFDRLFAGGIQIEGDPLLEALGFTPAQIAAAREAVRNAATSTWEDFRRFWLESAAANPLETPELPTLPAPRDVVADEVPPTLRAGFTTAEQARAAERLRDFTEGLLDAGRRQIAQARERIELIGTEGAERARIEDRYRVENALAEEQLRIERDVERAKRAVARATESGTGVEAAARALEAALDTNEAFANQREAILAAAAALRDDYADAVDDLEREGRLNNIADDAARAFSAFKASAITNFEEIGEAARELGRTILNSVFNNLIAAPIGDAISTSLRGFFTGLQGGGPAAAGRPYIVGEAGPELFVPDVSGTVIPSHETMNIAGAVNNFIFSPTIAPGVTARDVDLAIARAFPAFEGGVRASIGQDQRRPSKLSRRR